MSVTSEIDAAQAERSGEVSSPAVGPERLRRFFAPRNVALVGVSESSQWSRMVIASLSASGLSGRIIPVNPRRERVFDIPAVATLADIAEPVDLVFCMVNTDAVESVMRETAAAGIRNLVVLASGFGEDGEVGRAREARFRALAEELDLTVLGPNTLGFLNPHAGAAPFGLPVVEALPAGSVGVVLQSGALASAVLHFAGRHEIGLSLLTSMGNEAVIRSTDVLAHLIDDPATRSIAMFLESIREPARFLRLAREALRRGKPIVVLKVGRSAAGQASALAHTGAVAGDDAVVDSVLRRAGVVRVSSLEELLVTADLLAAGHRFPGRSMGVVSASGGACDIIADRASDESVALPDFTEETTRRLGEVLPPFASARNPLDVTGFVLAAQAADGRGLAEVALEAVTEDPNVDVVLNSLTLPAQAPADEEAMERRLTGVATTCAQSAVPVLHYTTTCVDVSPYARDIMRRHGFRILPGIELALSALGHALRWQDAHERLLATADAEPGSAAPGRVEADLLLPGRTGTWSEAEGRALAEACGVRLVPARLVKDAAQAEEAVRALGGDAVLKICSRLLPHKSDVGGVLLSVDARAAADAYAQVRAAGTDHVADPEDLDGVLVSPMRSGGQELFVGITRDPLFGPVLALGLGGVFVEILKDVSLRTLPVSDDEIVEMLNELKGAPLLNGARGRTPADMPGLARAVRATCAMAHALGDAMETVEINPLRVDGADIEALDVLVVTREPGAPNTD